MFPIRSSHLLAELVSLHGTYKDKVRMSKERDDQRGKDITGYTIAHPPAAQDKVVLGVEREHSDIVDKVKAIERMMRAKL